MRYVRFLKTPRLTSGKDFPGSQIHCLITITSDLGDSFLPYDVQICAELLSSEDDVLVWRTVQWRAGMRTLAITLPLSRSHRAWPLRMRVGVVPKSRFDLFEDLGDEGNRGIVSAYSAELDATKDIRVSSKFVERRFCPDGAERSVLRIWEETGESIARHVWDAGITVACHLDGAGCRATLQPDMSQKVKVLELGAGCGIVGISIAQYSPNVSVLLTDLAEAHDIATRNIDQASPAEGSDLEFQELNWDEPLSRDLKDFHLIIAADCTYNSDSSPALVRTLRRLVDMSPQAQVMIAMKRRHDSEEIFFDLMDKAGMREMMKTTIPLPDDFGVGEEEVLIYTYHLTS